MKAFSVRVWIVQGFCLGIGWLLLLFVYNFVASIVLYLLMKGG